MRWLLPKVTPADLCESGQYFREVIDSNRRSLYCAVLIALLAFGLLAFYKPRHAITIVQHNRLLLGEDAVETRIVRIDAVLPGDLSDSTLNGIMETRRQMVAMTPSLARSYAPSPALFESLDPSKPWFGTYGHYFYGTGNNGHAGPAVASRLLLNPALLAAPEFDGLSIWDRGSLEWNFDLATAERVTAKTFPLQPSLESIRWDAANSRATARYRVSQFIESASAYTTTPLSAQGSPFFLDTVNARDWGFDYVSVSSAESSGISGTFDSVVKNEQRFELNDLCGREGGCNHLSPTAQALSQLKIKSLPATVAVKLWTDPPVNASDPAAFTFLIELK